jgi:hypothetical protein
VHGITAPTEFRVTLDALGIPQQRVAELFGVGPRTVRRWRDGDRRTPCGVRIVLRLLVAKVVSVDQLEEVAASAQTNGSTKPVPPAPLRVESVPEQKALARAEIAADPNPSIAEKVVALAPGTCRWPHGDPGHSDFRFCGAPAGGGPYCAAHCAVAYVVLQRGTEGASKARRPILTEKASAVAALARSPPVLAPATAAALEEAARGEGKVYQGSSRKVIAAMLRDAE